MQGPVLTKKQARRFILLKQGLIGGHRFTGKAGALAYVRQAGCIQFDPIDVCGKNAELVLQSRVQGFRKEMLYELLYQERSIVDYFDKNLSIFPVEDWPCFSRERERYRGWGRSQDLIEPVRGHIREEIARRGPLSSAELDMDEKVDWYWSDTRLARAALEHMYFTGELAVHHKQRTVKHYDLIENCIDVALLAAPDPHVDDGDFRRWRVERRIGAVGLLWNRASDAWLCIEDMKNGGRDAAFSALLAEGRILELRVDGIADALYYRAEDAPLLARALGDAAPRSRCEFLAPLDNMLWDRRLIRALFDFDYKWEIYTPQQDRKYGYYVLPVLYGDALIGRIELVYDRKRGCVDVKNLWHEEGLRQTAAMERAMDAALARFTAFHLESK